MTSLPDLCPCCSNLSYAQCCRPFHKGKAVPKNALELMRSRYSAYALNLSDYIIATTHPASPQYEENQSAWRQGISKFSKGVSFQKLEILDFKEQGILATVTFTAYLSQDGQDATFTERSYFEKARGRWMYRGGQLAEGHAPNLATTGQLRLLPLAYYGEPILRKKAEPVGELTADIKKLIEEMIETMDACDGVGLAAPQIHHSIRLFVIRTPIEDGKGGFECGEPEAFINPAVSSLSQDMWSVAEGCLSIPTVRAEVQRPKEISVEYTNLSGKRIEKRCSGWEARVILHEYDHIEGILFIDRLQAKERAELEPVLQSLKKRIHDGRAL